MNRYFFQEPSSAKLRNFFSQTEDQPLCAQCKFGQKSQLSNGIWVWGGVSWSFSELKHIEDVSCDKIKIMPFKWHYSDKEI